MWGKLCGSAVSEIHRRTHLASTTHVHAMFVWIQSGLDVYCTELLKCDWLISVCIDKQVYLTILHISFVSLGSFSQFNIFPCKYFHTDTIGPLGLIAKLSLVFSHVFNFCKSLADQGFLFAASCHRQSTIFSHLRYCHNGGIVCQVL